HVYVGLASVSFLVAKLWRIGVRTHVEGVTDIVLWHRWLSAALGVLYAGVYLTGVLVLVPWPASIRTQLVDAHLIASVWAAVPTTWHAWHHRRMAAALLRRPLRSGLARRVWLGIAITLLPAAVLLAVPRALSPLTVAGAGSSWTPVGPRVFLDR